MKYSNGAKRLALSGLLLALMLVLGYVESLLPSISVPGIRLGLSNSVLIFAVYMLGIPNAYILMVLKVMLSGLLFGGVSAIIYAFAGGLMSLTAMVLLSRIPRIPVVVVSMLGGLFHNLGQMVVAVLILHTPMQMMYYFAVLCVAGLACGLLTGLAASSVLHHLKKQAQLAIAPTPFTDILLIVLSLLLIAAGITFSVITLKESQPVSVSTQQNENTTQMMTEDELKKMLQ